MINKIIKINPYTLEITNSKNKVTFNWLIRLYQCVVTVYVCLHFNLSFLKNKQEKAVEQGSVKSMIMKSLMLVRNQMNNSDFMQFFSSRIENKKSVREYWILQKCPLKYQGALGVFYSLYLESLHLEICT